MQNWKQTYTASLGKGDKQFGIRWNYLKDWKTTEKENRPKSNRKIVIKNFLAVQFPICWLYIQYTRQIEILVAVLEWGSQK